MILRPPEMLSVGLKAERGLFHQPDIYALRPDLISVVAILGRTELQAGQETPVVASSDLPPNADVRTARAILAVGPPQDAPDPAVTNVSVVRGAEPAIDFALRAEPAPGPSNVSVRLEGGEVFWTQSGVLSGSHELPDFADQLNAYLDRLASDGTVAVTFFVRSDTAGSASISLTGVDHAELQTQTWTNDLDDTVRVDRNLEVDFGTEVVVPLDPPARSGVRLSGLRFDLGGRLGPERLYGDLGPNDGRDLGTVSSDYSLAQRVVLDSPVRAVGVDGLFLGGEQPEVYAELQPDAGGAPAAGAPLGRGTLAFERSEHPEEPLRRYIAFEAPVELETARPYWIILRSVAGVAHVALGAPGGSRDGSVLVNRGGRLWRPVGGAAAEVGVVYEPGVDNATAAVSVGLVGAATRRVDPTGAASTVELDVAGADSPPTLVVRSYARGTVSLANVIQELHR